jgi:hypothetical protein
MRGARETVAKALALECMRAAKAQERGCYVFAFAGPQEASSPSSGCTWGMPMQCGPACHLCLALSTAAARSPGLLQLLPNRAERSLRCAVRVLWVLRSGAPHWKHAGS